MHFTDGSWLWRLLSLENYLICWKNIDETGFYVKEQSGAAA